MAKKQIKIQEQEQKNIKSQFLNFVQGQDKTDDNYFRMITSDAGFTQDSGINRLEAMVRTQLKREIPNIEKSQSYEFLVDAVMQNYMKKQLQATDGEIA